MMKLWVAVHHLIWSHNPLCRVASARGVVAPVLQCPEREMTSATSPVDKMALGPPRRNVKGCRLRR